MLIVIIAEYDASHIIHSKNGTFRIFQGEYI